MAPMVVQRRLLLLGVRPWLLPLLRVIVAPRAPVLLILLLPLLLLLLLVPLVLLHLWLLHVHLLLLLLLGGSVTRAKPAQARKSGGRATRG